MKRMLLIIFCILGMAAMASAQQMSRWALGRPSLLIDVPGRPSAANLDWVDKNPYSFFPTAWAGEDAGLRVEVGRISWPNDLDKAYANIAKGLGLTAPSREMAKISGRRTVGASGSGFILRVIGTDPETNSGSVWAVLVKYNTANLAANAQDIISGIVVEREGSPKMALRGLGTGRFAAMLPYELLRSESSPEHPDDREFEAYFDGMQIRVISSTPAPGYIFNADSTIKDIIEGARQRADKDSFAAESSKIKIGDEKAVLVVMDMKDNGKPYKIYKVLSIEKRNSMTLTITTDQNDEKQQQTARYIIGSLRTTTSPMYGWSTYRIGSEGLLIDSPIAPKPPRQQNQVTIYTVDGPLFGYEIRELQPMYGTAFDPDFSAKNYFEINSAISKEKNELLSTDKLLIDGFQARLLHIKVTSGKYTYERQMLLIYGGRTEWIIDIMGTPDYKDLIDRAIQSVRVSLPPTAGAVRQSFGNIGLSFRAFKDPLTVKTSAAGDESTASMEFPGGAIALYEVESDQAQSESMKQAGTTATNAFLGGVGETAGLKLAAVEKESHPVVIDGVGGLHMIYGVTLNGKTPNAAVVTDTLVFRKGNRILIMILLTNWSNAEAARTARSSVLNSLRMGY